ncbi:hypothetical protein H634G_02649 [Metarhizium anisopliae BRIP 53293]|uniref:Uncharacterized protein n=1 Tax=Metarhizium anisopliae BRIP 53293 TaxID=1291518 RepID=A0A0D9PCC6_METAN|nr:hypothetical protein H634G_02649 [Metarhizium anisopliae BRIP 53293]KJK85218.1 hypothetical protein H633G_10948 [Metarhizium anisopliae BRIP 53284]
MTNRHVDNASASSSPAKNRGSAEEPDDTLKQQPLRPARAHIRGGPPNYGRGHYSGSGNEQDVDDNNNMTNDSMDNDDGDASNNSGFVALGLEPDADAQARVRLLNRNWRMTRKQIIGTEVGVLLVVVGLVGVGVYKGNTGTTAGMRN